LWQMKCQAYIGHYGMEAMEIFDAFYDQVYHMESSKSPTMQEFIWAFHNLDVWIKKDVASKIYPQVRLMTVHGSKGLQAPIVILADANFQTTLRQEELLYMHNRHTLKPSDSESPDLFKDEKKSTLQTMIDEERRLLYVAMTRAEDELYIFGKGTKVVKNSWYDILSHVSEEALIYTYVPQATKSVFQHANLQQNTVAVETYFKTPIPKNLLKQPDFVQNEEAANRGSMIHKLFEILPHTDPLNYVTVIKRILKDIDHKNQITEDDIKGVITIMNNPLYTPFLSEGGHSELSLTFNGQLYRIDRVVMKADTAYILDFKTGVRTPSKLKTYYKQLHDYGQAIAMNYPIRTLKHYILWIDSWALECLEDQTTLNP
ncbi:MAG: 3'-5' exonuclease, partial [Alphaproteobacteria bacterium]|nr:3'-5' exonuclease [Alphaproteobacteria bacterium]